MPGNLRLVIFTAVAAVAYVTLRPMLSETPPVQRSSQNMVDVRAMVKQIQTTDNKQHLAGEPKISRKDIQALIKVNRSAFIPPNQERKVKKQGFYVIKNEYTLHRPYTIALALALINPKPQDRVLTVGDSVGYLSAVMATSSLRVYRMYEDAGQLGIPDNTLAQISNLTSKPISSHTDYFSALKNWEEVGPYRSIIVLAPTVPRPVLKILISELLPGGNLIIIPTPPTKHMDILRLHKPLTPGQHIQTHHVARSFK